MAWTIKLEDALQSLDALRTLSTTLKRQLSVDGYDHRLEERSSAVLVATPRKMLPFPVPQFRTSHASRGIVSDGIFPDPSMISSSTTKGIQNFPRKATWKTDFASISLSTLTLFVLTPPHWLHLVSKARPLRSGGLIEPSIGFCAIV